jgi:hypothetical protein
MLVKISVGDLSLLVIVSIGAGNLVLANLAKATEADSQLLVETAKGALLLLLIVSMEVGDLLELTI